MCRGEGRVRKNRKIQIHIPAGVDTGARLRVAGEGESGGLTGRRGDLYVVLHVREHEVFKRDGQDLFCEVPISISVAALGGTVRVPTIAGAAELKIPAGTQNGTIFRLRGKGVPSLRRTGRGDQLVRVLVEVPVHLNSAQKRALQELARTSTEKNYPRRRRFMAKAEKFLA